MLDNDQLVWYSMTFLLIMTTKPSKCNLNFKSNQQWKRAKKDLFDTVKSEINYLAKNTDQKYLALCLDVESFFFDFLQLK